MKIPSKSLVAQLKQDTQVLAMPEGRRVGQPGHDVAREYLHGRLTELGLVPFRGSGFSLPYQRPYPEIAYRQDFTNLVGVIPGKNRELPPILLGAHYDSVIDAPCADDNATSVAMNLAIAEEFAPGDLERDLIIALFDAEEPPHFMGPTMGSTRFYEDHCAPAGIDFAAVIVSDLIGHDLELADLGVELAMPGTSLVLPNVRKTVFVLGAESDPGFPEIVEQAAGKTRGLKVFPTLNRYVGNLSDHHAFEQAGQPFLFLSCAQGKYYHHPLDDLRWINFKKLAKITGFTAELIRGIDENPGGASSVAEGDSRDDTLDFELRMIRKAIGPALPLLLKGYGIDVPKSRSEMDRLIGMLV